MRLAASLLFCLFAAAPAHAGRDWARLVSGRDYAAGEILVQAQPGAGPAEMQSLAAGLGCRVLARFGKLDFYHFKIPAGKSVSETAQALEARPDLVKQAEPNFIEHALAYTPLAFPNDTYYQDGTNQWNLSLTHWDQAFNTATGGMSTWGSGVAGVVIAILDSGVNTTHPDLVPQMLQGWNETNNSTDVSDNTLGHGSSTASQACAATNNGPGMAGGAFSCRFMPVKLMSSSGTLSVSDSINGINWAVAHGASVINMSYGGPNATSVEAAACTAAYAAGVVLVAASGDDASNATYYPAGFPSVIAVGGTDSNDVWWDSSASVGATWGSDLKFSAPAGSVLGASFAPADYALWSGTSESAPAVSGLCAMLISNGVNYYECVSRIARTCDKVDATAHPYASSQPLGTWSTHLGYGRINFYRALSTLVPPSLLSAAAGVGQVSLAWSAPPVSDAPTTGYNLYRATAAGGPYTLVAGPLTATAATDVSNQGGAPLYYQVRAVDANGFQTKASNALSAVPTPPSPTLTPSATGTATPTRTPTVTPSPSNTRTVTGTPTITPSPSGTFSATPSPSPCPTLSASPSPSSTATPSSTPSPTASATSSATASPSSTATQTVTASQTFGGSPSATLTPAGASLRSPARVVAFPDPLLAGNAGLNLIFPTGQQTLVRIFDLPGELVAEIQASAAQAQAGALIVPPDVVRRLSQGIYLVEAVVDGHVLWGKWALLQPSFREGQQPPPGWLAPP